MCQAKLVSQLQNGELQITGYCRNQTESPLAASYELTMEREGRSGSTHNTQGGRINLAPAQEMALSQTTINYQPTDVCSIRLKVFDEQGQLLAQDSLIRRPDSRP
ncbi:curli-like amyloid fiber formation chaperone CsgH [Hymenobacter sp. UYP22]|uniref:curli-like amyloid fiber formation chaperone CsgH n=1 Tax=Hymenobacter sp. UYP22 TaxID=3156348 RepID=UPI003392964F